MRRIDMTANRTSNKKEKPRHTGVEKANMCMLFFFFFSLSLMCNFISKIELEQ